jgi:hypothetical protein
MGSSRVGWTALPTSVFRQYQAIQYIAALAYLTTLPAANIYILERVLQSPLVPLPAHRANHRGGIPLEELGWDGTPHIALEGSPLKWQGSLGQAERVRWPITNMGFGDFVKDLRKDFVRKVVDVHYRRQVVVLVVVVGNSGEVGRGGLLVRYGDA